MQDDEVTEDTQPESEESVESPKRSRKGKLPELDPEQIASRQLAHDIKVAKFLAGGEF